MSSIVREIAGVLLLITAALFVLRLISVRKNLLEYMRMNYPDQALPWNQRWLSGHYLSGAPDTTGKSLTDMVYWSWIGSRGHYKSLPATTEINGFRFDLRLNCILFLVSTLASAYLLGF